jgi:hypothetical protein
MAAHPAGAVSVVVLGGLLAAVSRIALKSNYNLSKRETKGGIVNAQEYQKAADNGTSTSNDAVSIVSAGNGKFCMAFACTSLDH